MPTVESGAYLLGYLWELGPTVAAGMGAGPVTFTEIACWQMTTGTRLAPWEVRAIRRLSHEYLNASHKARERDAPAPWIDVGSAEYRTDVLPSKIKSILRG